MATLAGGLHDGAVYNPDAVMAPTVLSPFSTPLTNQFTEMLLTPVTCAVNCSELPAATLEAGDEIATAALDPLPPPVEPPPPPEPPPPVVTTPGCEEEEVIEVVWLVPHPHKINKKASIVGTRGDFCCVNLMSPHIAGERGAPRSPR